jgi:hypothetical protein
MWRELPHSLVWWNFRVIRSAAIGESGRDHPFDFLDDFSQMEWF